MTYVGSWKIDDLLTFYANTTRVDTGAATDADSVPTYRVYEDETGTAILTGSMALLDSSNTAGFYSEQITLSAANGFEKGKCYAIYIQATVNSIVGATHRTFQIEAEVDANRINWANVDNPTTAVNLSATNIDPDQVVASVTGAVGSVTADVGITQTGADKVWLSAARTLTSFGTLVADVWAFIIEGAVTAAQSLRLNNAAQGGKTSGMDTGTPAVIRDIGDTKDRVSATVDANGNRTAVTLDLT